MPHMMQTGNIFEPVTDTGHKELFIPLLGRTGFRLEQIISYGRASEPEFWYDQETDEWVMLARGRAELEFDHETVALSPGDYLLIPARTKHRIASCSQDAVWLALHVIKPVTL